MDTGGDRLMDIRMTADKVGAFLDRVDALTNHDVFVGIPAAKTERRDATQPINNATLAFIHEHGSPARNIPARPFLHPGIRKAKKEIVAQFSKAALEVLDGKPPDASMHRAGMIARNSVVKEITDPAPPFTPLSPVTIRARLRRTQAGRRKLMQLSKQGKPLGTWAQERNKAGNPNIRPLIDTGQLRAAITYVVRKEGYSTRWR